MIDRRRRSVHRHAVSVVRQRRIRDRRRRPQTHEHPRLHVVRDRRVIDRQRRPAAGCPERSVVPSHRASAAVAHIHVLQHRAARREDDAGPLPRRARGRIPVPVRVPARRVVLIRREYDREAGRAHRAHRPVHKHLPELAVELHDHARIDRQRHPRRHGHIAVQHVRATRHRPLRITRVRRRRNMRRQQPPRRARPVRPALPMGVQRRRRRRTPRAPEEAKTASAISSHRETHAPRRRSAQPTMRTNSDIVRSTRNADLPSPMRDGRRIPLA